MIIGMEYLNTYSIGMEYSIYSVRKDMVAILNKVVRSPPRRYTNKISNYKERQKCDQNSVGSHLSNGVYTYLVAVAYLLKI